MSSTSAKTAKQVTVLAEGGEEDGNEAADAFEAATKKLRVSTTEKDDEISLILAKFKTFRFRVGFAHYISYQHIIYHISYHI